MNITLRQQIDFLLEKKKIAETMFVKNEHDVKYYDTIIQTLIGVGFQQAAEENEKKQPFNYEKWKKEIEGDLKDFAFNLDGGFTELLKIVEKLKQNDDEAAFDRHCESLYEGDGNFADNH